MKNAAQKRSAIMSLLKFAKGPRTAGEIADQVGIAESNDSCPSTRKLIRDLIETGHPIGSTAGGYRLLQTGKEVQRYLNSLLKRQIGISHRIEAVYEAAKREGLI
jgi:hypothetical protein